MFRRNKHSGGEWQWSVPDVAQSGSKPGESTCADLRLACHEIGRLASVLCLCVCTDEHLVHLPVRGRVHILLQQSQLDKLASGMSETQQSVKVLEQLMSKVCCTVLHVGNSSV